MLKTIIALYLGLITSLAFAAEPYDLLIQNGRVIDPESGLDAVRHVAISNGVIQQITTQPVAAKKNIDASGLVVAPGFIDIHSHTPTLLGQHLNLLDGITTQLDLEAGAYPVAAYGDHFLGGAQLNYGASVGHWAIRSKVMENVDQAYFFTGRKLARMGGPAWLKKANDKQIATMRTMLHQGLDEGGLGIGVLLDYMTSAVSNKELRMVFAVAAERKTPVYVHVRRGFAGDPAGLKEVLTLTEESGASLLICHITHSAMGGIEDWLAMIDAANKRGADISTETLSYAAGGTSIAADVFRRRDWRRIFDISYEDVQWTATGEWLTEETWNYYAKHHPEGMVNHHYVKEAWMETALRWPRMMVSTDALPALDRDVFSNPNIAGTFSRVLGHYVRERGVLSLQEALAKMSLYQAQWMERAAPQFKKKGRLQQGMDADIVVFDPATVNAKASYQSPYQASTGIHHVIVSGRQIVVDGKRIEGRYPGRKILAR
jgi:N-acyl-D-aspartate/D-glutamate deacylase